MPTAKWKLPSYYRDATRLEGEEDAAVWLWAAPSMLPWPTKLEWLFSPVVGKKRWPGDLWGVDADGELILVENKKLPIRDWRIHDPFIDFRSFQTNLRRSTAEFIQCGSLRPRWDRLYRCEVKFGSADGKSIWWEDRSKKSSVLPNSHKRGALKRWQELAKEFIGPRILPETGSYSRTIGNFLNRRQQRSNPPPHYCGLLLDPNLNDGWQREEIAGLFERHKTVHQLAKKAGANHVHLFFSKATKLDSQHVAVSVEPIPIHD